jgi:hypothetical protein
LPPDAQLRYRDGKGWEGQQMKIRLGLVFIPLVSSLYLGAALANEKQFQDLMTGSSRN